MRWHCERERSQLRAPQLHAALDLHFAISRGLNRADAITCLMHISAHWNFAQAPPALHLLLLPGALGGEETHRRRLLLCVC